MTDLTFIIPDTRRLAIGLSHDAHTGAASGQSLAPASRGLGAAVAQTEGKALMSDREIDQQLVVKAQSGDKRAFELLVIKYQRKVERLLSRIIRNQDEIEDVSQEAFIKAYRALGNFRGDSAFYTWLYRIAVNTAKNYLISQGRRAPTSTRARSPSRHGI